MEMQTYGKSFVFTSAALKNKGTKTYFSDDCTISLDDHTLSCIYCSDIFVIKRKYIFCLLRIEHHTAILIDINRTCHSVPSPVLVYIAELELIVVVACRSLINNEDPCILRKSWDDVKSMAWEGLALADFIIHNHELTVS